MITWYKSSEKMPEEGDLVAAIYVHNKKQFPMSYQIMFGLVSYTENKTDCRVESNDATGNGSWSVYFLPISDYLDTVYAWTYAKNLNLPKEQ